MSHDLMSYLAMYNVVCGKMDTFIDKRALVRINHTISSIETMFCSNVTAVATCMKITHLFCLASGVFMSRCSEPVQAFPQRKASGLLSFA